ncbi:MAG: DUF4440 domain-containing protein [Steroidobacteraceae bacterium]
MLRTRSSLLVWAVVLVVVAGIGCSYEAALAATPSETRAADAAAIRAKDGTFEQGVAEKNVDNILALYEDGAVLFAPKAPAATGKDAIREAFKGLLMAPGVKMKFKSTSVHVSRSRDLAVQRATFQVETTGKDGKPSTEAGQSVVVWRKQSDGSWKIMADTNADDK